MMSRASCQLGVHLISPPVAKMPKGDDGESCKRNSQSQHTAAPAQVSCEHEAQRNRGIENRQQDLEEHIWKGHSRGLTQHNKERNHELG
jgi:hypothetical protein